MAEFSKIASQNADHVPPSDPHSSFVLSLSEPFFEVPLYRYGRVGTCRREITFEMNCRSSWSYRLRVHRTLSTSSQPASSPLYTFPETPSSSGISPLASRSPGYPLSSPLMAAPMPLILNIVPVLHPWSVTYFYLYDIRLLTLHWELVSWGHFLLREHVQRGELLLITMRWSKQGLLWGIDSGDHGHYSASQAQCSRTWPDSSLSLVLGALIFV